jgi:hypothetical protein
VIDESEALVKCLWDIFLPEITSGEPVRFCFSHDLLQEHFAKSGLTDKEPENHVCAVARDCFSVSGNKAFLSQDALEETSVGSSKAIILVCQQIIAVEEMISDGAQYSENAYFPRLRKIMDARLPFWSANPFSFDEFESIWKTFAREVWKINGSSHETITFEFDAYEGANKARQFPLSQALFSIGDLSGLATFCRLDRLRSVSADDVWSEIRRERQRLGRRAQRLINSGFLRERLIEQVRKFAERRSVPLVTQSGTVSTALRDLDLFISLDTVDGEREEYFAFLVSRTSGMRIDDPAEVSARIESVLGRRGYAYCALNNLGDCWTYDFGEIEVGAGNPIVLLTRKSKLAEGKAELASCFPALSWDDSRIRSLGFSGSVCVAPVVLPEFPGEAITIKAGSVVGAVIRGNKDGRQWIWVGGICIDARSRKYLFPYLPTSIRFGHHEFGVESILRVSGTRMQWSTFVNGVSGLESDAQYELQFPNGLEARLSVAIRKESPPERMGFLFDSKGRLSPTLERLEPTVPAIVGFACPVQRVERPAELRTVANLLRDLQNRTGRRLTEKEQRVTLNRVNGSTAPATVKRLVELLIERQPFARDDVLRELLD